MNDDRFEFEKLSRPSVWLNLVGRGSKWRAGVGYLPPTSASALKTGKTGVLGADGEPDISPQGRKLTDKEKARIAKTDQEMIAKEKAERAAKRGGGEKSKPVLSPEEQRKKWVETLPNSTNEFKKYLGKDFTVKSERTTAGIEIQVRPSKSVAERLEKAGSDPYRLLGRTANSYSYQAAAAKIIDSLYPHLQKEWIDENLK